MPRFAPNKMPPEVKRRYFELLRSGIRSSVAARLVGVSVSCGSLWFLDAGAVHIVERPISGRYFSQDDRIEIADGLRAGDSVKNIADRVGKSYQSVYREIARNRKPDGTYQPWYAHNRAHLRRRRPKPRRVGADGDLARVVAVKLRRRWSPAQISRWLRRRHPRRAAWHVCAETIYQAVYHGHIPQSRPQVPARDVLGRRRQVQRSELLRTGRTYRRRRGRGRTRDGALKQCTTMRSIHDRPPGVLSRREIGHWEGDLIIGSTRHAAIATLVERKTRFTVLVPLPNGYSATAVADALSETFRKLPAGLRKTLTWDQGNEMFHHPRIENRTGLRIYFADPHSPWQRGTNENTNGLLRQYLPKGTDLGKVEKAGVDLIANELNDRPRLCLGDRTPTQEIQRWERRAARKTIRDDR
jgi:IS30 family transposase